METDLIFHHGIDLPEFAAFPLLDNENGRELLGRYYRGYADLARSVDAPLLLEPPPGGRIRTGVPGSGTTSIGCVRSIGRPSRSCARWRFGGVTDCPG